MSLLPSLKQYRECCILGRRHVVVHAESKHKLTTDAHVPKHFLTPRSWCEIIRNAFNWMEYLSI